MSDFSKSETFYCIIASFGLSHFTGPTFSKYLQLVKR